MRWADEPSRDADEAAAQDAEADLLAMLAAGRELGPEMDRALAESYLTRHEEPPAALLPTVPPSPEMPLDDEMQPSERSFAPWLIPAIVLFSMFLFAAPFHVGGFFPVMLLVFFLARNHSHRQRLSGMNTAYTDLPPTTAPDPMLAMPPMPATVAHPAARFDVVLMHPGVNQIATIKIVRMLTGMGLREAKLLTDFAPRTLLQGVSADRANIALAQLSAVGAHVALQAVGLPALPPVAPPPASAPQPPFQQWPTATGTDGPSAPPANPAG